MNIHFDASDVNNKLEKMAANLTMGLHNALAQAGEIVRADAVANCPVDTGRLKGSITNNVDGNSAVVGTNVSYAPFVEWGTGSKGSPEVAHTTKEKWIYCSGGKFYTTSGMAPQPFLVPALKSNREKIVKLIKESISG